MTDEQIQYLILKVGYNDRRGVVHLSQINTDYGIDMERVRLNAQSLEDKGLVRQRLMRGSTPGPLVGDIEITDEGRREYKSRCEQQ